MTRSPRGSKRRSPKKRSRSKSPLLSPRKVKVLKFLTNIILRTYLPFYFYLATGEKIYRLINPTTFDIYKISLDDLHKFKNKAIHVSKLLNIL